MSDLDGTARDSWQDPDSAIIRQLSEDDDVSRLHERLAAAAQSAGVLDVAYDTVDTPVGTLLLATTEEGLVRVAYPIQGHDAVLAQLASDISPRILHAPEQLREPTRQLDEYFAGRRRQFDLQLDNRLSPGFRRSVLSQLPGIGYGSTVSYGELAAMAGNPKAARAVGTACGANPLPVVVPCHRVVRSDGSAGGYAGGPEAKEALLKLEGAA
ncbi:methylated-DNA--[protein]-cysteine S-methyltransferase [Arthrobacter castelli]|uniref:methylated-DNA--[protein]-cysteine S-methyltransferase n=1 Tax=Arthrobacter castelli TaxID=271431 RepID=UPI0003FAED4C|nr:methylated-DNA--[protein]-cysteine S-methyltransferase [Arthrobacter castelli]